MKGGRVRQNVDKSEQGGVMLTTAAGLRPTIYSVSGKRDQNVFGSISDKTLVVLMKFDVWITDRPPPCARDHRAVVLSCSHLARRWAVLECRSAWLVVNTSKSVSEKPTALAVI